MAELNPFAPPVAAEPTDRPVKRRTTPAGVALLVLGIALMTVGGCVGVLDFGSHVDGPGVGAEFVPFLSAVLLAAFVVGVGMLVAGLRRAHWLWLFAGVPLGSIVGTAGAALVFGVLVPWSWRRACDRGEGRACWGASAGRKPDAERATWAAKGCRAHDTLSCERWLELDASAKPEACAELERAWADSRARLPAACEPAER